ncbi:MAG: asparagine synthase (glutamine-hydrolyzing) [Betaproteobacteria bacterium]|nr:asparagine synthase (glutamine-hydrolyzing) [Betaproteobacteria bacterium]
MCGIYGIASTDAPVDREALNARRDLMRHRGPDDAGWWVSGDGRVGLAHRRLSVVDLSSAGHQPMASPDRRHVIVYNGEVYNFKALRAELERLGHRFLGHSDTEVVLAAYREWGERCIERFNGMFALAIYDAGDPATAPSIFFARDRAGKKPLYYAAGNRRFEFGSELKALGMPGGIDAFALNHYLALGYVPDAMCLAAGVRKLPPAHAARLDLNTLRFKTWRYWELPPNDADPGTDGEALADQVHSLLMDAVRLRLESDVPLGVLLSGGLDSGLIVAAAARQSPLPVKTFTVSVPGSPLDEAPRARAVAQHFGTEHHVLALEAPSLEVMHALAPFIDEPIADSSLIPTFLVSKLTREHVTVALGGDGGDELFGGYLDYPVSLADERRLGWLPPRLLRAASRAAGLLPAGVRGRNRVASWRGGALQQMIWGSPYFDVTLRRRIFTRDQLQQLGENLEAPERFLLALFERGRDPVDCMTRTHFGSILPDDFLVKVDRAGMAASLEIRSPFLDHRLVEFCFSAIPGRWKVADGETRRIQKILARRLLPPGMEFQRKQGFSIPIDDLLRADNCAMVAECAQYLPRCINRREVNALVRGLRSGRANGARLYALLALAIAIRNLRLAEP